LGVSGEDLAHGFFELASLLDQRADLLDPHVGALTQIVNEQVTTLHLCEKCAAEKGVENPGATKTPLGSFLAAMGKGAEEVPASRLGDVCSRCGGTFQDFRETGHIICDALTNSPDIGALRARVDALCAKRPLYPGFRGYTTFVT